MVRNIEPLLDKADVELPETFVQTSLGTLERAFEAAIARNPEPLTIGAGQVNAVDSAALNWLLGQQSRLASLSLQMVLQKPSALLRDALLATRLDHRFQLTGIAREVDNA